MLSNSNRLKLFLFSLLSLFTLSGAISQRADTAYSIMKNSAQFSFWDSLPAPTGWVNDFENLFTTEEERLLDSIINDFKNKTTIEIAIVTLDTYATPKDRFVELTLHMAQTWGIGVKEKNNGILIGISKGYRKIRIENGRGITKIISDEETKNIIDNDFIPSFKEGNYFEGTLVGLMKILEFILKNENH